MAYHWPETIKADGSMRHVACIETQVEDQVFPLNLYKPHVPHEEMPCDTGYILRGVHCVLAL